MDFFKLFRSEVPDLKKEDLLNSMDDSKKILTEVAIKTYDNFIEVVGNSENKKFIIKNSVVNTFFALFSINTNLKYKTINEALYKINLMLKNTNVILDKLPKFIEEDFSEEISTLNLSYPKANYLALVQCINYTINFSVDLINLVISSYTQTEEELKDSFTTDQINEIKNNVKGFSTCFNILMKKPDDIKKHIKEIPDYIIDDKTNSVISNTYPINKIDPFAIRNFNTNPFFFIAMRLAEWRAQKYTNYTEKKKLLELKLLALKNRLNDNPNDLNLQKSIDYTEGRVSKLNSKIKDIEEDVKGN